MRDLSVYFCRTCGFYAYYQLPRNAVCPKCNVKLTRLDMRYQDFMDLDYRERDQLISQKIVEGSSSLVQRICAPAKLYNQRELISHLTCELEKLTQENQKLNETIDWMHKTIWDQMEKSRELEQELNELKSVR